MHDVTRIQNLKVNKCIYLLKSKEKNAYKELILQISKTDMNERMNE